MRLSRGGGQRLARRAEPAAHHRGCRRDQATPSTRSRSCMASSARAGIGARQRLAPMRRLRSRNIEEGRERRRDVQVVIEGGRERLAGSASTGSSVGSSGRPRDHREAARACPAGQAAPAAASDSSESRGRPGNGPRGGKRRPAASRRPRAALPTRAMFPPHGPSSSRSIRRWAQCSQVRTNGGRSLPPLWAISSSWCGKMRSTPPVWMSNDCPRCACSWPSTRCASPAALADLRRPDGSPGFGPSTGRSRECRPWRTRRPATRSPTRCSDPDRAEPAPVRRPREIRKKIEPS